MQVAKTSAKINAANASTEDKSPPTRGIQANSLIMGENSKKWPSTFIIQEIHLIIVVYPSFSESKLSNTFSALSSLFMIKTSTVSWKTALKIFTTKKQQMQVIGHDASVDDPLSSP